MICLVATSGTRAVSSPGLPSLPQTQILMTASPQSSLYLLQCPPSHGQSPHILRLLSVPFLLSFLGCTFRSLPGLENTPKSRHLIGLMKLKPRMVGSRGGYGLPSPQLFLLCASRTTDIDPGSAKGSASPAALSSDGVAIPASAPWAWSGGRLLAPPCHCQAFLHRRS